MKNVFLFSILLLFAITNSCKKSSKGPAYVTPPAPSNLIVTILSATQSKLTWTDNSNNEDGFKIERKTNSSSFTSIANVGANITTYIDQGLVSNTTYSYRVVAFNSVGNSSSYSNETITTTTTNSPVITTSAVDSITGISAKCGGNVTGDGGSPITTRGVVWNTMAGPTFELNTKTNDGTGMGTFTSRVTGLAPNTIYYIRAYAINSTDTAYGNEISFTTPVILLPSVSTEAVTNITLTTANSGGNITNDGGAPVTARGVCWSINPNPSISLSTKTNDGSGTGAFTSSVTGLTPNTTYYLRSYATNSAGTAYGNELAFFATGSVIIGTQVWMSKNLDVSKYRNGDLIPNVPDLTQWAGLTTGAWNNYNNDPLNGNIYGKLYNGYAVLDPRELAPLGWHIPSMAEWNTLVSFLGTAEAADRLRDSSWISSPPTPITNSSRFSALPGGKDSIGVGGFGGYGWPEGLGSSGYWWTNQINQFGMVIFKIYSGTSYLISHNPYYQGYSVRCIKD